MPAQAYVAASVSPNTELRRLAERVSSLNATLNGGRERLARLSDRVLGNRPNPKSDTTEAPFPDAELSILSRHIDGAFALASDIVNEVERMEQL
jgi:hypothetical protein